MQIVVTVDPACGADMAKIALWVDAWDDQAAEFCKDTGKAYMPVVLHDWNVLTKLGDTELAAFTKDSVMLIISNDIDAPGALGFHDYDAGVAYIRVEWQGDATSVTGSHEVLETLGDLKCDSYKPWHGGETQAEEYADRVEADTYGHSNGTLLSNYLLPDAFVQNGRGPFDKMGRLRAWDGMTGGGYVIVKSADGAVTDVFAMTHEGRAAGLAKLAKRGRAARRVA